MGKYIFLFDSGNGGKYVLDVFKNIMPNENYIFYMDKDNCPYGNKPKNILKDIVTEIFDRVLSKYEIKLIVVACNTMGSMFDTYLRKRYKNYKILFIRPFINKTILKNKTLLLATSNTIIYNKLIKKFKGSNNLYIKGFDDLAKRIDNVSGKFYILKSYLDKELTIFKNKNIKNIVLGCTHYNYIKKEILETLPNVKFYENSDNLAKNAYDYLSKKELLNKLPSGSIKLISRLEDINM